MNKNPLPTYDELATENEILRSAIYKMMAEKVEYNEEEMARSLESAADFAGLLAEIQQMKEEAA